MQTTRLGDTQLEVSRICLGTWQFGGDWGEFDRDEAKAAVRRALDLGINFERNLEIVECLGALAERHGLTVAQLAIAWTLTHPAVEVAIVGARNPQPAPRRAIGAGRRLAVGLRSARRDRADRVRRRDGGRTHAGERVMSAPTRTPNVAPGCLNVPGRSEDGFEELCHLVAEEDPDTALCGRDVTGYPWNPPWPRCEACLAVARGDMS